MGLSPELTGRKQDGTFMPGQSGNPAGRPKGSRQKLQTDFLKVLADDFAKNGRSAVEEMRTKDPAAYVKAIASLMPKQLEIERPLGDMTDDELISAVDLLRSFLAAQETGKGTGNASLGESAGDLSALH
jgi:hypothetical protein